MGLQLVLIGIGRLQQASAAFRKAKPNSPWARLLPALSMVRFEDSCPCMHPSIHLAI
jgi:hypothetical protein